MADASDVDYAMRAERSAREARGELGSAREARGELGSAREARGELGARIAELAKRQHGVLASWQLAAMGLSTRQIQLRIASGLLHPIHRGVYAVGHTRLTHRGRWMAAVLAGGPDAVLSHRSAAMLWQLLDPSTAWPHITTPRSRRRRRGLMHHRALLPADEITIRDGIPVTTVARTLVDLAAQLDRHRLEQALAEAEYRRYADWPSLPQLIERHRGRPGIPALRAILASQNPKRGATRSPLEERFLRFLDQRGLERPEVNAPLQLADQLIVVDCLWRNQRVALELDGRASHLRVAQWEADRLRDRRLLASGWRPCRVTSEQLDRDPDGLESDLLALDIRRRGRRQA